MTKRTIACPSCQKSYAVSPDLNGKKIKCPKCQAVFVLNFGGKAAAAPAKPVQATVADPVEGVPPKVPTQARQDFAKMGLDGPLGGQEELFSDAPPTNVAGLDNYAANAGFAPVDPSRFAEPALDPFTETPLVENPALSHAQQLAMDIRSDKMQQEIQEKENIKLLEDFKVSVTSAILFAIIFAAAIPVLVYQIMPWWIVLPFTSIMGTIYTIWVLVEFIKFLNAGFRRTPTHEVLLSIFIPFYFIVYMVRFWKDIKFEATAYLIASLAGFAGQILGVIVCVIAIFVAGPPPDLPAAP